MNPIRSSTTTPVTPALAPVRPEKPASAGPDAGGFADQLRQQLDQVAQLQQEAEQGMTNILTGRTDNLTEVLASARKAEVAFNLLMEMRNKLVDAYNELKQLRV